jgi:hypothetical protein
MVTMNVVTYLPGAAAGQASAAGEPGTVTGAQR